MESSKFKVQSSDKVQSAKAQTSYFDLEERMDLFGERVIQLCKKLPINAITKPLISQIVGSSTSIGANYAEANNASSRKDFRNKVHIAKKEAQETKHWLRMLKAAVPEKSEDLQALWQENHELCLILQSIASKVKDEKGQ